MASSIDWCLCSAATEGGQRHEIHDDPSVSVRGAGIDALLLERKRFHLTAF